MSCNHCEGNQTYCGYCSEDYNNCIDDFHSKDDSYLGKPSRKAITVKDLEEKETDINLMDGDELDDYIESGRAEWEREKREDR